MATGRAKEGVSSPINTHTRAWQLDSPPLAPAAARWLPRAAPRAGGAGAQRRRGPGGARGEAVLGRGASPACLWKGLVPPELARPTWERRLFSSTWLQCQRESGEGSFN